MSTVATRFTKFQVGAAAAALTAATVLTPAMITPTLAHATPSASTFVEGVGNSVSSLVDPVITLAAPSAVTSPCATADFAAGCYAVEGVSAGTQAIIRGAVVFIGPVAYVVAAGTGQLFKALGSVLPGPVGTFFTSVGDGISAFANQIAITFQVGPYQTAQ
jgi:hypothetical protein